MGCVFQVASELDDDPHITTGRADGLLVGELVGELVGVLVIDSEGLNEDDKGVE